MRFGFAQRAIVNQADKGLIYAQQTQAFARIFRRYLREKEHEARIGRMQANQGRYGQCENKSGLCELKAVLYPHFIGLRQKIAAARGLGKSPDTREQMFYHAPGIPLSVFENAAEGLGAGAKRFPLLKKRSGRFQAAASELRSFAAELEKRRDAI